MARRRGSRAHRTTAPVSRGEDLDDRRGDRGRRRRLDSAAPLPLLENLLCPDLFRSKIFGMKGLLVNLGRALAPLLLLAGCGSSSGGTCASSAACGGNIVGTWTIGSSCVTANASMFDSQCPSATVSSSNVQLSGTFTFNGDMTYTSNVTSSGSVVVTLPASCLTMQGVTVTCDQITQVFQANPTPGVTFTCTGSSSCTCNETVANATSAMSGTYTTTAAGLLTETASDGTVSEGDYCVKGTTLTESTHADSAMMGQSVSGTLTLTKN
jgi:hypothetical protein